MFGNFDILCSVFEMKGLPARFRDLSFCFVFLCFTIAHGTNWKRQKRTIKKNKQAESHTVGRSFVTVPSDVDLDCKSNNLLKNRAGAW